MSTSKLNILSMSDEKVVSRTGHASKTWIVTIQVPSDFRIPFSWIRIKLPAGKFSNIGLEVVFPYVK